MLESRHAVASSDGSDAAGLLRSSWPLGLRQYVLTERAELLPGGGSGLP